MRAMATLASPRAVAGCRVWLARRFPGARSRNLFGTVPPGARVACRLRERSIRPPERASGSRSVVDGFDGDQPRIRPLTRLVPLLARVFPERALRSLMERSSGRCAPPWPGTVPKASRIARGKHRPRATCSAHVALARHRADQPDCAPTLPAGDWPRDQRPERAQRRADPAAPRRSGVDVPPRLPAACRPAATTCHGASVEARRASRHPRSRALRRSPSPPRMPSSRTAAARARVPGPAPTESRPLRSHGAPATLRTAAAMPSGDSPSARRCVRASPCGTGASGSPSVLTRGESPRAARSSSTALPSPPWTVPSSTVTTCPVAQASSTRVDVERGERADVEHRGRDLERLGGLQRGEPERSERQDDGRGAPSGRRSQRAPSTGPGSTRSATGVVGSVPRGKRNAAGPGPASAVSSTGSTSSPTVGA